MVRRKRKSDVWSKIDIAIIVFVDLVEMTENKFFLKVMHKFASQSECLSLVFIRPPIFDARFMQ